MLLKIETDEESDSGDSSLTMGSEEDEVDDDDHHHLLTESNSDVAFLGLKNLHFNYNLYLQIMLI